jgi:hypothetical protein
MPKVGIFWVHKGKVIGKARDISEGIGANGWIDSPDQHVTLWEHEPAFARLRAEDCGYESVPRGRMVWQQATETPVIYMDKKLLRSESAKKNVAAFFGLDPAAVQWKSDPHYTTDPCEIAKLFDA